MTALTSLYVLASTIPTSQQIALLPMPFDVAAEMLGLSEETRAEAEVELRRVGQWDRLEHVALGTETPVAVLLTRVAR